MKPLPVWAAASLCLLYCLPASLAQGVKAPKDDPAFIKKAALTIDQNVATWYRRQKLEVPAVTDDATFMRRTFLVTIGRIPTAEEARAFLEISDAGKRLQLVDYLLASPGYSSHLSNWTFDLLRLADGKIGSTANNEPYRNWVRNAVADDMPWDKFVHTMIAAAGDGWAPDTAAVGYYTRDRGMPLDNLANSMRIFLGSRMECAQCHDNHASSDDRPERRDFYELAAFTHGQGTVKQDLMQPLWNELTKGDGQRSPDYAAAQVIWDRVYGMSLAGGGTGRIALPEDYQYHDGRPGDLVAAKTPFGKSVHMSDKKDEDNGRAKLADWVVSKTGTQFAGNIANRLWKRVMGKAVYEPADIYIPAPKTNYPELMTYLEQLMVDLEYDQKAFQKVLLSTRTYQFATNPDTSVVEGGDDFHGRKIARISAEQIWDSLITLAGGDPDKQARRTLDDSIYVGGKRVLVGKKTMPQLSQEVLALKSEREVRSYFKKFVEDIKSSGGGSSGSDSMMMNSVKTYNKDAQVRASELPSPAPRDHLLYLFGQSDREVVDASSREPNIGQVLALMNGFVQRQLVNNPNAHLYKSLEGASTDAEKIRRLYIAILSRPPSDEEMGWMLAEVKASSQNGYRNIVSSLVMSSEFLFLQ